MYDIWKHFSKWWQEYFQACELQNVSQYHTNKGQNLWSSEVSPLDQQRLRELDEMEGECMEHLAISAEQVSMLERQTHHCWTHWVELWGTLGFEETGKDEE